MSISDERVSSRHECYFEIRPEQTKTAIRLGRLDEGERRSRRIVYLGHDRRGNPQEYQETSAARIGDKNR
jgi:hypothetical protein